MEKCFSRWPVTFNCTCEYFFVVSTLCSFFYSFCANQNLFLYLTQIWYSLCFKELKYFYFNTLIRISILITLSHFVGEFSRPLPRNFHSDFPITANTIQIIYTLWTIEKQTETSSGI